MEALLAQMSCRIGDVSGNVDRAIDAVRRHPDVDIAVFPELYVSGYTYRDLRSLAIRPDGPELHAIADAAAEAETAVVIGFTEDAGEHIYNSAACIDERGDVVGVYRKTYLFPSERDAGFTDGEEIVVVDLARRRVAPLICFDIEFPEPARQAMLAGAELLVTCSANMDPYYLDHEIGSRARAHENRRPHLYANMTGAGDGLTFVGASRSIAPTGEVLVEASRDREELLVVPVVETGGFDVRTDYPRWLRPPLRVARQAPAPTRAATVPD
jgi:predicted amidohydrolase